MIFNTQISGGGGGVAHSIQLRKRTQTGSFLEAIGNIGQWDAPTSTWTGWKPPTAACVGDMVYVKDTSSISINRSLCNVTLIDTGTMYTNTKVYYFEMPDYDVIIVGEN